MVTCVCPVGLSVGIRQLNEFPSGDSFLSRTEHTGFQTLQQSIEGHYVLHHHLWWWWWNTNQVHSASGWLWPNCHSQRGYSQEETWGEGDRGHNLPPQTHRSMERVPWPWPRAPSWLSGNNFCSRGEGNGVLAPAPISETFKVTSNKGQGEWETKPVSYLSIGVSVYFSNVFMPACTYWNFTVFFQHVCTRSWEACVGMDSVRQKEKYVWRIEKQNILLCVCLWARGPWH